MGSVAVYGAAGERLRPLKPWGESTRYDVVSEYKGRFRRVQVKSVLSPGKNGTFCIKLVGARKTGYTRSQIDYFAVYLISLNKWFIIPISLLRSRNNGSVRMRIMPGSVRCKWKDCEENWASLRRKNLARGRPRKVR